MEERQCSDHIGGDNDDSISINSIAETVTDGPICGVSHTLEHDADESDAAPPNKIPRTTAEFSNRGGFKFIPSNSLDLTIHKFKTSAKPSLSKGELVQEVHDLHLTLGGEPHTKPAKVMRKILSQLKAQNIIEQHPIKPDEWQLVRESDIFVMVPCQHDENTQSSSVESVNTTKSSNRPPILETLGTGNQAVYVYYDPRMRELSEFKNEDRWDCRIGSIKNYQNVRDAVVGQTKTTFSSPPIIALVIQCDDASGLENTLRQMLTYGKMDTAGRKGWFHCNPEVVKLAYQSLCKLCCATCTTTQQVDER
jgi:hypothetical protein